MVNDIFMHSTHNHNDGKSVGADSGVKTWKFNSNFLNRKSFWHMKGMIIPSQKMTGYKHGNGRNRDL